jgi:hypothetical protein
MVIRGGCKAMIHGIQSIFYVHLDWVVLQVDATNAFNTIFHKAIS